MVQGLVLCSCVNKSKVADDDIMLLRNPLVINRSGCNVYTCTCIGCTLNRQQQSQLVDTCSYYSSVAETLARTEGLEGWPILDQFLLGYLNCIPEHRYSLEKTLNDSEIGNLPDPPSMRGSASTYTRLNLMQNTALAHLHSLCTSCKICL